MIATRTSCLVLLVGLAVGAGLANGCSSGNPAAPGTGREVPTTPSGDGDGGCTGSGCGFCPQGAVCTFGGGDPLYPAPAPPPSQPPRTPFQPKFGPTVTASVPPPPISGGTLLVTHDGKLAIASDPDRDVVYVVNLNTLAVSSTVALEPGDEPGRLAEDGAGRIHVALRGDGALLTLDPVAGTVVTRRQVCPAPRGVAWDESSDLVWVACATGELLALPSAGGAARRTVILERDLRDVIPGDGSLAVTTFRSAEVLRLAGDGTVTRRDALPSPDNHFVPHVAWRAVAGPSGAIVSVHQAESTASLSTSVQGGYGSGGCGGLGGFPGGGGPPPPPPSPPVPGAVPPPLPIALDGGFGVGCLGPESGAVLSVLTVIGADGTVTLNRRLPAALPVDVAISPDGSSVAAIAPGDGFVQSLSSVFYLDQGGTGNGWSQSIGTGAQPIAVAFGGTDRLLVQTREPAQLWILGLPLGDTKTPVTLSSVSRDDTGHDVFHTQAGGMIACASCHPEGGDDGHVWLLDGSRRRTPSLRGTIAGTAPYHWPGDQRDLNALVSDVYTKRMSGAFLDSDQMNAIATWVQGVPAPPVPSWVDAAAARRGQAIFARADVGCGSCHSGDKLTNNATVDVGTGGRFQVPPLVGVGWRTPLLHDGCAKTIADRFGACATPKHGSIAALSAQDITDLTAYLETL